MTSLPFRRKLFVNNIKPLRTNFKLLTFSNFKLKIFLLILNFSNKYFNQKQIYGKYNNHRQRKTSAPDSKCPPSSGGKILSGRSKIPVFRELRFTIEVMLEFIKGFRVFTLPDPCVTVFDQPDT